MNQLEYRAWDKKGKLMQGIYDIVFCVGGVRVSGTGVYMGNGWAERSEKFPGRCDVVLNQYTGIITNKGEKIFFDDVVYVSGYGSLHVKDIGDLAILIDAFPERDVERLLGNIHENPELKED